MTWLVLGIAVALAYASRRRRGAPLRRGVPDATGAVGATGMSGGAVSVGATGATAAAGAADAARFSAAGSEYGATPDQIDGSTLARGDELGDRFVEDISGLDLEPDADLDVAVADPSQIDPAAGMRVEGPGVGPGSGTGAGAGADLDLPPGEAARPDVYEDRRAAHGSGELYGMHVTPAVDRELPDDDHAQAEGENWLEHLGASAAELGPEPELELDMAEDEDPYVRRGRRRGATNDDIPVADLGSAGPRGL